MYRHRLFIALLCCTLSIPTVYGTSYPNDNNSIQPEQSCVAYVNKICFHLNNDDRTAIVLGGSPNTTRDNEMIIPASIKYDGINYQVTAIADKAFEGNYDLSSVIMEGFLTRIGDFAFDRTNLTYIDIHNGVDTFGEHVFLRIPSHAKFLVPEASAEKYSKLLNKTVINPVTNETYFFERSIG